MEHIDEIKAVRALGEKIGYGNLMEIASALWDRNLYKTSGLNSCENGCFVPVCFPFIKDEYQNMIMSEHLKELNRVVNVLEL